MEILDMAVALGEAIKADSRTTRFQNAKSAYDADQNLGKLIREYNVQKMALGEHLKSENAEEATTDAIQRRIEEIYNEIVASPVMIEYSECEKALNDLLNLVNMTISNTISGEDIGCTEEKCKTCGRCSH